MERFIPTKRTAIDGKAWWVVYDRKNGKYSDLICHGKYFTKKSCQFDIDFYNKEYNLDHIVDG